MNHLLTKDDKRTNVLNNVITKVYFVHPTGGVSLQLHAMQTLSVSMTEFVLEANLAATAPANLDIQASGE